MEKKTINWEGADLCYYYNGESYSIGLSNIQFSIIAKILGLKITPEGVVFFSDDTLKQLINMKGNPLHLQEID